MIIEMPKCKEITDHMIGQGMISHDGISHPGGPQICLKCNKTLEEIFSSLLLSQNERLVEEKRKILNDFADWLCKKGYIDSDYYTEEPMAINAYLQDKES